MDPFLQLMYTALASPLGIVVAVSDVLLVQQKFSQVRAKRKDAGLEALSFRRSPVSNTEVWIVKK